MKIDQVKHAILWVTEFHDTLGQQYAQLSHAAKEPRLNMMLSYLSEHEHETQGGLARFLETAKPSVLEQWLRRVPDPPLADALSQLQPQLDTISIDDAAAVAAGFHTQLKAYFQQLADMSDGDEAIELFESIANAEDGELRRMERDTSRLDFL